MKFLVTTIALLITFNITSASENMSRIRPLLVCEASLHCFNGKFIYCRTYSAEYFNRSGAWCTSSYNLLSGTVRCTGYQQFPDQWGILRWAYVDVLDTCFP